MRDMATKHNGHIVRNKEHKMKRKHTKRTTTPLLAESTPPKEARTPQSSTHQTGVPNLAEPKVVTPAEPGREMVGIDCNQPTEYLMLTKTAAKGCRAAKSKSKTGKDRHICDFCNKVAQYASMKTLGRGPYSILCTLDGKALGLMRANLERTREIESYCKKHVPQLITNKINWIQCSSHSDSRRPALFPADIAAHAVGDHETALTTFKPKALAKRWALIDGEHWNRRHPDTFQIPSALARRNVEPGLRVKIALEHRTCEGERFWVDVYAKEPTPEGYSFIGKVVNRVLHSGGHGIRKGDLIEFREKHIHDISLYINHKFWKGLG